MSPGTMLLAAALIARPAFALDWPIVATEPSGANWSIQPGSVGPLAGEPGRLRALVMRKPESEHGATAPELYQAVITAAECGQRSGGIELRTVAGAVVSAMRYQQGSRTVGANLAAAMCRSRGSS